MIDEIFELVMKEARSRPGDDLLEKAKKVLFEVNSRLLNSFLIKTKAEHIYSWKKDKTP